MAFSYDIDLDDTARAKRRRRSDSSSVVETKGLGANLGSLARGAAVFDPNAYDGDGDGLVQDGTPFERPAPLANIAAIARGFASAGHWGNDYSSWTQGLPNEEIANVVVSKSPEEVMSHVAAQVSRYGLPRGWESLEQLQQHIAELPLGGNGATGIDTTPEMLAQMREALVIALDTYPNFRQAIDRFGMPPIVGGTSKETSAGESLKHVLIALKRINPDRQYASEEEQKIIFKERLGDIEKIFGVSIPSFVGRTKKFDVYTKDTQDVASTIVHEYGHIAAYQTMLAHPDPKVREAGWLLYNCSWQDIASGRLGTAPPELVDLAERILGLNGARDRDLTPDSMLPVSYYAATSPSEFIAEAISLHIQGRGDKLDNTTRQIVEDILGVPRVDKNALSISEYGELHGKSPSEIARTVIPDNAEDALEMMLNWAEHQSGMFPDAYMEGMTAEEKVQSELWRLYYMMNGKQSPNSLVWKMYLRKARRRVKKGQKIRIEQIMDFDPETVQAAREALEDTLLNNPFMRRDIGIMGMPPTLIPRYDMGDLGGMFMGSTGSNYIILNRNMLPEFRDPINPDDMRVVDGPHLPGTEWYLEANGKWDHKTIIAHEYGHYVNFRASHSHPDNESRWLAGYWWRTDWRQGERQYNKWRKKNPGFRTDSADRRWMTNGQLADAIEFGWGIDHDGPPHVMSQYAQTSPAETFAEAYAAMTSGDPERMARVSPEMRRDVDSIRGRWQGPQTRQSIVDINAGTDDSDKSGGFASVSITRDKNGTRDMTRAFTHEDSSPLDGADWLKDATPREIAEALTPRSREDAVNLIVQNVLMGNDSPDPTALHALTIIAEQLMDNDMFDFSPESVQFMTDRMEETLTASPQFLWQVRTFGSGPVIPTNPKEIQKYRDAQSAMNAAIAAVGNGAPTFDQIAAIQHARIDVGSPLGKRARVKYPPNPFKSPSDYSPDEQLVYLLMDGSVGSDGTLGYNVGGLFTVMNTHFRKWRGYFDGGASTPPPFQINRRGWLSAPQTTHDMFGRPQLGNISISFGGTIVHEGQHGLFYRVFGPRAALKMMSKKRDEVVTAVSGYPKGTPEFDAARAALESISGGRIDRLAHMFPHLSMVEREERSSWMKKTFHPREGVFNLLSTNPKYLAHFMNVADSLSLPNDRKQAISQVFDDYIQRAITRGEASLEDMFGVDWRSHPTVLRVAQQQDGMAAAMMPGNRSKLDILLLTHGWDGADSSQTWKQLATDFPELGLDPNLPVSTVPSSYGQSDAQEAWAELGLLMSVPDDDLKQMYLTPQLEAMYLYALGYHDSPYDPTGMVRPWESNTRGFASRSERVQRARETVSRRASNSLGNVITLEDPVVDSKNSIVSGKRESNGSTYFRVGEYNFVIPRDEYLPELPRAYSQWASESHYDMQQMSGMMMGLKPSKDRPAFRVGNVISNQIGSGSVNQMDSNTIAELRETVANTKRMMDEIRDGDNYSVSPLYHTLTGMKNDDSIMKADVGDSVNIPLMSFSPKILDARDSSDVVGTDRINDGSKTMLVQLGVGSMVMDSTLLSNNYVRGDWQDTPIESITAGKFKVVYKGEKNGIPYIEIEHTDVFDTDAGEFVNVDPARASGSVQSALKLDGIMRNLEKYHKERNLLKEGTPEHRKITEQIEKEANLATAEMFGDYDIPEPPTVEMTPQLMEERRQILDSGVSPMDARNIVVFASTSDREKFDRQIRLTDNRVSRSAKRMLEDNREFIDERMLTGRSGEILDSAWVDETIKKLDNGEITHNDAMNLMNLIMVITSDKIRKNPSMRDATDGDVYHYQKLGKRLRRLMVAGVSEEGMDLIQEEAFKPRGFASTTSRTSSSVDRFSPEIIKGRVIVPDGVSEDRETWGRFDSHPQMEAVTYEINGERVAFGIHDRHQIDTTGVRVMDMNPFDITGTSREDASADDLARNWVYSHVGFGIENTHTNGTEVSALLYASSHGDNDAQKELDRLAELGKKAVDEQKKANIEKLKRVADDNAEFKERKTILEQMLSAIKQKKSGELYPDSAKKEKITPKDIVLVRWSDFPPEYDKDGNAILKPFSDYQAHDRQTLHFTLNHSVEEHAFWQEGENGGYLIMVPLQDVLDANGAESLDNLYAIDTFFTPKPGQGLILPKQNLHVQNVKPGEDRKQITRDVLTDRYATIPVKGSQHYSDTPGFDGVIDEIAAELGVTSRIHANTGSYKIESENNYKVGDSVEAAIRNDAEPTGWMTPSMIADLSDNGILRLADRKHGKWSGATKTTVYKDETGRRGFVSTSAPSKRDLSSRVKNPQEAEVVRSIESRIGFASRSDAVNLAGKSSEEIARELELTPEEKETLDRALPDYEEIKKILVNPAISKEQKQQIIDSIRVRVEDGVPYITTDPHPLVIQEIPDKRDWSTVVVPSEKRQLEIRDFLEKMGEKVDTTDRATINQRDEEVKLNTVAFSTWLMDMWDEITKRHPLPPGSDENSPGTYIASGGYIPTALTTYFQSLYNMGFTGIRDFFGEDDFLNAHDLWGHAAIGRGFDRHGEWANMLAIFSMMDRWSEEKNIPEIDVLRMKAMWFQSLEYTRFSDRFIRAREDVSPNSTREWFDRERGVWDALSGMADEEDLRKLIGMLDHGRVHDSAKSKGFASASSDERTSIVANDVVRQSRRLTGSSMNGFASRSGDWKTNTHGVETGMKAPTADTFHADKNGRTVQAIVPVGNEVKHPLSGKTMTLDRIEDSVGFVRDGGNLSEVPDAHLLDSIYQNTDNLFVNTGRPQHDWRFERPNGRFTVEGLGVGQHGTVMMRDMKTNLLFGVKFDLGSTFDEDITPLYYHSMESASESILIETVAASLSEQIGFEPMAVRVVTRSKPGSNAKDADDIRTGPAMIIEFAQNRYPRIKEVPETQTAQQHADIRPSSNMRMFLYDVLIGNEDRNNGNWLLSRQSDGTHVAVPIDAGSSLTDTNFTTNMDFQESLLYQIRYRNGMKEPLWSDIGSMDKKQLREIIREVLPDFQEKQREKIQSTMRTMEDTLVKLRRIQQETGSTRYTASQEDLDRLERNMKDAMVAMFRRWDEMLSWSPDELADRLHSMFRGISLSESMSGGRLGGARGRSPY